MKIAKVHEQKMEYMQDHITKAHVEAKKWWNLAKDYFDAGMKANQSESTLTKQIDELKHEWDTLK